MSNPDNKNLLTSKFTHYIIIGAVLVVGLGLSLLFGNKQQSQISYLPAKHPKIILRLHGSNIEGIKLAPALATGYLQQLGASETATVATIDSAEGYIQGYLPETRETVAIEIFAHGSGTSFQDMAALETDIAMSSRPIKIHELDELKLLFGNLASHKNEITVASDGLAIIVHKFNPVESLTIKQIAELLSGEVIDWYEVGGNVGPVNIHARDEVSGAYDTINSLVLKPHNKELSVSAKRYKSVAELADAVAADWNGIGFVGLPFAHRAKPIAVADTVEIAPILPTLFTVATEDYPLMRRLYFYVPENSANSHVRGIADYALSAAGQAIAKKEGFVNHSLYSTKLAITQVAPKTYQMLTNNAERLSLNFRFKFGSSELDSKAKHDITRLDSYLKQHTDKQLMLFGFTDNVGSADANLKLSEQRAWVVKDHLEARNIYPFIVRGFGKAIPIASNATAEGRHHNRRVEVWIK